MAYLLATIDTKVRWYVVPLKRVEDIQFLELGQFTLLDQLDLEVVPGFGNKDTAKRVAMALGLKTWRYVKMDGPKTVYELNDVGVGKR
jgi:hypothetical protein